MAAIRTLLGAEYAVVHPRGAGEATGDHGAPPRQKYIQVDVRICSDLDQLCWTLFKHAHGDLWNLLGSTIRPLGLTVDEEALWLRIPEIEALDRKKAKVCLTRDPVEVLHFLGLKVEGFWDEPFASVDALFDYATTCRFFWVRETPEDDAECDAPGVGVVGGEQGRGRLKANERRRLKGRPVYRRWINEFIPSLRAQGKFIPKGPNTSIEEARAALRDEAFSRFFVEPEYRQRLRDWQLKRDNEQVKSLIKELVPGALEPQYRACLVSAMRRIIMEDDATFGVTPPNSRGEDGFYDTETIRNFVQDNWELVGGAAWAKQQQRAQLAMQLKACGRKRGEETGELDGRQL
ncbi:ac2f5037-d2d8-49ad-88c3-e09e06d5ec42 [Thermothielavioides terrestris]|uniref:Ac2f5037-d2d8-49ad-88c3-e09e06d5ec42 n=1 Tax=Thermothielavioides terrestris TaxID=2587410 RepID=A0A446B8Y9_9PEZI|nr:ac2f5037-d2d8-49ad-88c3-e09e06d5ec42 [Thermothielavioides terrestris]